MFPFKHGDELVFQPPSVIKQEDHQARQDNSFDLNTSRSPKKKGQQRSSSGIISQEDEDGLLFDESFIRKLVHRDIERRRRREMSHLYASLQSVFPPEYLKGKKSTSDLLQETINYITDTKNNIKKLGLRRDILKNLLNSCHRRMEIGSSSSSSVTVNQSPNGVEILISSNYFKEEAGFPLSKVLNELVRRGFNVVSSVTTKSKESLLIHSIQCEASDLKDSDLSLLQHRLSDAINLCHRQ